MDVGVAVAQIPTSLSQYRHSPTSSVEYVERWVGRALQEDEDEDEERRRRLRWALVSE